MLAKHAAPDREMLGSVGVDLGAVVDHPEPAASVRETVNFTYDDHQAATATTNAPGQPNRVRAVRDATTKYAVYLDPNGRESPEYELYDLERDPEEAHNLLDTRTGAPADRAAARLQRHLDEQLSAFIADAGRLQPRLAGALAAPGAGRLGLHVADPAEQRRQLFDLAQAILGALQHLLVAGGRDLVGLVQRIEVDQHRRDRVTQAGGQVHQ